MIGAVVAVVLALLGPTAPPDIEITGAWAPPPLVAGRPMAVYMRLTNHGPGADRLIGVRGEGSARAGLHLSTSRGGIARMRAVEVLELAVGQSIELAPGGYHIMLMGPRPGLKAGDRITLTLEFEKAGPRRVGVVIKPRP